MWLNRCSWTRARLPLLAGGELLGTDRRKTERHLIGCSSCRERLTSLRASVGLLHAAGSWTDPTANMPPLWPSLSREIRESRCKTPSRLSLHWDARSLSAAALAATFLIAIAGSVTWSHRESLIPSAKVAQKAPRVIEPVDSGPAETTTVAETSTHRPEGEGSGHGAAPVSSNSRQQVEAPTR